MKHLKRSAALLICALPLAVQAASDEALKAFPAAQDGYQRHVVELPTAENEDELKVEIIGGKQQTVDCNVHRLGGQWQEEVVEGWGYNFYQLSQTGPGVSTLMACPEGSAHEAFVRAGGEPYLVRYNSKLPLVIYAPTDIEVRYRLWAAEPDTQVAPVQ